MYPEDGDASHLVEPIDQNRAIETAGAQQRRIKNFRAICRRQNHEAGPRIEAVHVNKKLIEGLLLLVVAARIGSQSAGAAERIKFVDEDDGRRLGPCLLEQVA